MRCSATTEILTLITDSRAAARPFMAVFRPGCHVSGF
jgi:hypothetical protein